MRRTLTSVSRTAVPRNIRHGRPSANVARCRDGENHRPGIVGLRNVLRPHIPRSKDGDEWRRSRSPLHVGPSLGFFPLHQTHRADHFKSKSARGLDCLDRGCAGGANIVNNHHARTLLVEAFNPLARPVLLFRLAHEKTIELAAYDRNCHHNGIGSHGKSADSLRFPIALPNFIQKNFARQARALGIQSCRPAIDVVVAGRARGQFEFAQPEGFISQQPQQILARGIHKNLRYHGESASVWASHSFSVTLLPVRRGNLNILLTMMLRGMKLQSVRKFSLFLLAGFLLTNLSNSELISRAFAEGTRTWEQAKFDELTKGTATGIAIRNAGGLELAPTFKSLYTTPSTYIWAMAADDAGIVYAAAGAPARVYRITPDGKATIIFEPKELQVQTLQTGPGGIIYAATAPDGKVYKLERTADGALWRSTVYFEPGTKYIWDLALDKSGNLYVATGDHGEIYRVTPKGEHSVFFKSDETHIRVLVFDAQNNLIAGSDGSGLIYRISPAGEGFVLYSAPKKEITALALDAAGNIYAAAVGEKKSGSGSTSSNTAAALLSMGSGTPAGGTAPQVPGMTITMAPTTGTAGPFPFPGGSVSGGSDIYRIAPDGSPAKLWTSHEDIVYALSFDSQGRLLAGTGNRGHIFAITGMDDFSDLLKAAASQVTAFAKAPGGGVYAATSNLGKVFVLGPNPEAEGTYESDVFDARIFSRWGRAEFRGAGSVDLYARSGNVDNPDRNWSAWKKIDLSKNAETGIPAARYAQWKAVLYAGTTAPGVDSVTLNYLPKKIGRAHV